MSKNITIPTDEDGFVLLQCHICGEYFKLLASEVNDDSTINIWCPYCGLNRKQYAPNEVIDTSIKVAENELNEIIYNTFKKLEKETKNSLIQFKCNKKLDLGKDEISALLDEYNERKTDEALFAYHCDKLECDIQMKLYDQEGCFDLKNQPNNPIINNPSVRKVLDSEKSISNAWIEFDRSKYEDDKNFIEIIEYLKENEI